MVAKGVDDRTASLRDVRGEPLERKNLKHDENQPGQRRNVQDSEMVGVNGVIELITNAG